MNPHNMATLFLTKVLEIYDGVKTASSTNCVGKSAYLSAKKLKPYPCLSSCISVSSKWIKDLNIRPKTVKLVPERAGNNLEETGIGKDFFN
jgi:hypothetical protein